MKKRLLVTILTLLIVGGGAALAVFLAKGYRLSPSDKTIFGTGILSITSTPDQASVYLDGHLTTATDANVNSLEPKVYDIKIIKEGFIPWTKKIEIKQGLVTDVKATLFPAIPSVYPLSFNGAQNLLIPPDDTRIAFVIPGEDETTPTTVKKGGIWVWDMKDQPVSFTRGREPHQVLSVSSGYNLSNPRLRWSPDSTQILVTLGDPQTSSSEQQLLLDASKLNDNPRDITPVLKATLQSWDQDLKTSEFNRFQAIKDLNIRQTATGSAFLKWSPDETKLLFSADGTARFMVADLIEKKIYELPEIKTEGRIPFVWLSDSRHFIVAETPAAKDLTSLPQGTISIIEYDGGNKSVLYAGQFDPKSLTPWPDSSRLVVISSLPTPTASQPNLFGINLK